MLGVDIDKVLVKKARNLQSLEYSRMLPCHFEQTSHVYGYFPMSFPMTLGSIPLPKKAMEGFPSNLKFKCCNFLEDLSFEKADFDIILW